MINFLRFWRNRFPEKTGKPSDFHVFAILHHSFNTSTNCLDHFIFIFWLSFAIFLSNPFLKIFFLKYRSEHTVIVNTGNSEYDAFFVTLFSYFVLEFTLYLRRQKIFMNDVFVANSLERIVTFQSESQNCGGLFAKCKSLHREIWCQSNFPIYISI